MNVEYLLLLTILLSVLIFLFQRTETKKRLIVLAIMLIPIILIRNFVLYRNIEREAWVALGLALFLNFTFWVLIGRYNPVPSSDNIRVLGMDD